jgi:hypothetical protein
LSFSTPREKFKNFSRKKLHKNHICSFDRKGRAAAAVGTRGDVADGA